MLFFSLLHSVNDLALLLCVVAVLVPSSFFLLLLHSVKPAIACPPYLLAAYWT